ncbi:hypothetical protein SBV1_1440005 [Verrucomicrobia bacterium]|nr:hypothetical protein SBV1_1440005 [Verrucomicrobiota bacterium]
MRPGVTLSGALAGRKIFFGIFPSPELRKLSRAGAFGAGLVRCTNDNGQIVGGARAHPCGHDFLADTDSGHDGSHRGRTILPCRAARKPEAAVAAKGHLRVCAKINSDFHG